jgi:tetratricopeptide (TPR) repeat protein
MIPAIAAAASDAAAELDQKVRELVLGFGYADPTADAFVAMVQAWPCGEMQQKLEHSSRELKRGKISVSQYAEVEKATAERLAETIRKEVPSTDLPVERSSECYDLADVARTRQTHCLGYTQMFFILGSAVGLKVQGLQVEEHWVGPMPINAAHVACLVELRDGKALQVDLTGPKKVSEEFVFDEHYAREGEGWRIKDTENRLLLHPKIVLLDRDGIGAMVYTMRAMALSQSNKAAESLEANDKAIALNPRCGVPYYNRANYLWGAGHVAEALADYEKAVALMPRHPAVYSGRGYIYLRTGRTADAVADCTKAIELDPKMADAYGIRATAYAMMNQFDEAMADYTKMIALNPNDAAPYGSRGSLYAELGKLPEAVADYTKAIQLDPTQVAFYYNRGLANLNAGRNNRAVRDFTKVIELQADSAMAHALRGTAKAGLGKDQEAKEDLEKALELDPDQIEVIKNLASQHGVEL